MIYILLLIILIVLCVAYVQYTRKVWFYRDPDHGLVDQNDGLIRSPVYGIVVYIKPVTEGKVTSEKLGESISVCEITKEEWPSDQPSGNGWLIGIAMTALDVHYQYAPLPGVVGSIEHFQTGFNLPMFDLWEYVRITWLRQFVQLWGKRYLVENERQTLWIQNTSAKVALILIADKFVDKITTYIKTGEVTSAGQKLSFIARGSQVDVLICGQPELEILVKPGDRVLGPQSSLAKLQEN